MTSSVSRPRTLPARVNLPAGSFAFLRGSETPLGAAPCAEPAFCVFGKGNEVNLPIRGAGLCTGAVWANSHFQLRGPQAARDGRRHGGSGPPSWGISVKDASRGVGGGGAARRLAHLRLTVEATHVPLPPPLLPCVSDRPLLWRSGGVRCDALAAPRTPQSATEYAFFETRAAFAGCGRDNRGRGLTCCNCQRLGSGQRV